MKAILNNKDKPGGNILPEFKTFYKAVLTKRYGTSTNTDIQAREQTEEPRNKGI